MYISVVEMLSCPKSSCKARISTLPYWYIRVAAVCLNLCVEYLLISRPAFNSSFFTIVWTVLLLILSRLSLKNKAFFELYLMPSFGLETRYLLIASIHALFK